MNLLKKRIPLSKAYVFMLFFLTLTVFPAFCQTGANANALSGLREALGTILGFFSSGYMKAILSIALGGLAVGLIMNRGEPGVVKKFIPWIAACVLLLSLSSITGVIFKPATASTEITPTFNF